MREWVDPVQPTPPPPDAAHAAFHELKVARWLRGTGVEIGAFKNPVPGIRPFYVDRFATYVNEPTGAEYEGDATALPFHDHSLDYVVASHVLEHLANPIAAFREWNRVLRHRGIIYLVVPDRRFTWDHAREPTPVAHLLEDDARGTTDVDPTHIDDFVEGIDWSMIAPDVPTAQIPAERAKLRQALADDVRAGRSINIHFHVFEPANLLELIETVRTHPSTRFDWHLREWQDRFPASCPNGIWMAIEVRQPWPARLVGWRHRRLTRRDPRHPLLATARRFDTNDLRAPVTSLPPTDPAELSRQLDDVMRREATFRLKTIQTFRDLDQRLRREHARADALSAELGERNTYIHTLHEERARWPQATQQLHEDVAQLGSWLDEARQENQQLKAEIGRMKAMWCWRHGAWWRQLQRWLRRAPAPVPPPPAPVAVSDQFVYFLHTSPFRVFRARDFVLRGWIFPRQNRTVSAVRARLDDAEFIGRWGLEEPEVAERHQLLGTPHTRPGFEIPLHVPPGAHHLRLEVQLDHREWQAFLTAPIWGKA